jgi:hypothetical protein
MSQQNDLRFGLENEKIMLKMINEKFGDRGPFLKTSDQFHPYDFVRENEYIELKSRRCNHNTYPTTMISQHKINYAKNHPECKFKLLFSFKDGVYSYDVDTEKDYEFKRAGRWDRGRPELNQYAFIPVNELIRV